MAGAAADRAERSSPRLGESRVGFERDQAIEVALLVADSVIHALEADADELRAHGAFEVREGPGVPGEQRRGRSRELGPARGQLARGDGGVEVRAIEAEV